MNRILGTVGAGIIGISLLVSPGAFAQSSEGQPVQPSTTASPNATTPAPESSVPDNGSEIPDTPEPRERENKLKNLPSALLHDQIGMWTSPSKARIADATWLVPLGGLTAALLVTDRTTSQHLSNNPNTLSNYKKISDYGAYSMAGGAAGLYFLGAITGNQHERETGFLSGEAAVDSLAAVEVLKYAFGRQRPYENGALGKFGKGGSSFPSEHSAAVWSIAGIVAHEYPSPFMKLLSYGTATLVSASRITAKQHFPSDVLVGMAIGYLTSEYVYRKHHNYELAGGSWESPGIRPERPGHWQSKYMGSPYVPLDSWIYPAMERLAAMGFIDSDILAMRPWTRSECARQLSEAGDRISDDEGNGEAARLYQDLMREFNNEVEWLGGGDNAEFRVESAYTRGTYISGKPLTNSYYFGQTIINDFGRPEEEGFNNVSGLSGWVSEGPFTAYIRSEFQHSPSAPALPLTARMAITNADFCCFSTVTLSPPFPVPPDSPTPAINRGRLLDAYVAMNLSNWQLSYGKQSLWWGADEAGGMMFSDNAEPLTMFRINRITPFKLPSIFGWLGPMRVEFFVGQYSGQELILAPSGCGRPPCLVGQYGQSLRKQPFVHGERFSFKPTPNFEFGMSRTTDYGGDGYPLTWHNFLRSVFSTGLTLPGDPTKPGSRRSGLDFRYRLRNGLVFYGDGFTEHDTFSPIVGPDVAAWLGGVYIPKLPGIPKMDFRAEGMYTDPPIGGNVGHGFFYYDPTWLSGFTNNGQLMGDWVGREGQGVQAWTSYWLSPRNKLQFQFRHLKVSHEFITNGGTMTDGSVRADLWVHSGFSVSAEVQYEAWTFPVLSATKQSNVSSSVQVTFWPKGFSRKHGSDE